MHQYNDAGQPRAHSGGYCGVRAVVIAVGMEWADAEKHLREFTKRGKAGNGALSRGIYKEDYIDALAALGWHWQSAPKFDGRKARAVDLEGTVIAQQAGHYVAVIDGVTQDIWNCSRRMVYGYWKSTVE